jgi:rubrerythrin
MENDTIEIQGISRGAFLVRGALATGAAYGAASVTPWVTRALAQGGSGDVAILNFALTLEYLEADFYKQAGKLSLKGQYKSLAKDFGAIEQEHVDALKATIKQLGGKPVKSPAFAFGLKSQADFVKLAITLEDTGVSAYNGAAPMIQSKDVLAAAGSIVQVEARHAAALRFLDGKNPTRGAFDKTLPKAAVLKAVKPLIKA